MLAACGHEASTLHLTPYRAASIYSSARSSPGGRAAPASTMTSGPATSPITVTFWGAAHTVTGSMHLVEAAGQRLLLDCGLFQGRRAEAYRRNREFPFTPHTLDTVIISHAHIDHIGNLPNLVRRGFRRLIHCTPAT